MTFKTNESSETVLSFYRQSFTEAGWNLIRDEKNKLEFNEQSCPYPFIVVQVTTIASGQTEVIVNSTKEACL